MAAQQAAQIDSHIVAAQERAVAMIGTPRPQSPRQRSVFDWHIRGGRYPRKPRETRGQSLQRGWYCTMALRTCRCCHEGSWHQHIAAMAVLARRQPAAASSVRCRRASSSDESAASRRGWWLRVQRQPSRSMGSGGWVNAGHHHREQKQ